ncbi:MAG: serine/threonine protein kinase [Anaerolineae bacterium]|nr:serine/threonine protein kinase [Anaerolineae bacterium]
MEELIGKELGQYRIEEKIGQGAMASVFKAYQPSLERYVAIKVLPPYFAAKNPVFSKRFKREAKSVARLHHPNILPVYDYGIDRDYSYIVMRYVEGAQTLAHLMYQSSNDEQKFDVLLQVARALAQAHENGVIHRDVTPSNVLMDKGWALLSDFGLAKFTESATRLTGVGKGIGTPAYMSPEQARGGAIDHRTDIYALGVILYEILTKTIPHDADTSLSILLKRTTEPPPAPRTANPAISKRMEQVVMRAMASKPEHRFETANQFAEALKTAMVEPYIRKSSAEGPGRKTNPLGEEVNSTRKIQPALLAEQLQQVAARPPFWMTGVLSAGLIVLAVWGTSGFGSFASQITPTQTIALAAAESSPTSTATRAPTFTSTPTVPPTKTPPPSSTPAPTNTPILVTPTPFLLVVTATATSTPTPTTQPTDQPTLSINTPTTVPTVTPTPTVGLPNGSFTLISPISLDNPTYGPTNFEWDWNGPVPANYGFEIRVWRENESPAGAHDAVLDNQQGRVQKIGENRYQLNIDISQAAGVRGRTSTYLWTVVLVQIDPSYADLGLQAEPSVLRFEAGGGSSGGGDSGSSGGGGGGGGIK